MMTNRTARYILILSLSLAFAFMCSLDASAQRILEMLALGPIPSGGSAPATIDKDLLKSDLKVKGGEEAVASLKNGPKKGDKAGDFKWEVRRATMADQFDVDALWGNKTNHTAYFYVYIKAKKKLMGVSVWQGSDDTLKSWLNGKEFWAHRGNRGITVDSDKTTIDLNAGWNSFMAKVCETGGGWRYNLNFPDGKKLGLQFSADRPKDIGGYSVELSGKLAINWARVKSAF